MKNRRYLPVLVIAFVWFLFSFPFFVKQQVPFPSRYLASFFSPWNAYSQFYGPVKNGAMPDIIGQIYPWKTFTVDSLKNGFIPLWNPYSFGGTPHLANYQSAVLSPISLGFFIMPFIDWWSMLVLLQPLLAGLFMYLFAKTLKQSAAAALISSISFMFCGFITCWMGYATLGYAILFLPLALFAIQKYYGQKKSRYLFLLSVSIPMSFFSGHFQISLYFLLFTLAYVVFKFFQTRNIRATCYMLLSAFSGLLICAPQLFPTIELYSQSFRSVIFQKAEVIPWGYLPTLLAPDFFGNPVTRNAWFGSYAEWNGYVGIVGVLLFLYSLKNIKKGVVLFFALTALIGLLFAFDSPLLNLLVFLKIPVLSTSALSRVIVLFSFSVAVLAGFGLDAILKDIKNKKFRGITLLLLFSGLIITGLWLVSILKIFLSSEHAVISRSNLKLPTLILLIFYMVIGFGMFVKSKKTPVIVSMLLVLLLAFDMLRFSTKWMPFDPKNLVYPKAAVTLFYPQIEGSSRVLGEYGAEGSVYYRLPSVVGYDAVYIRRYGQFIASLDLGVLKDSYRSVVEYPKMGKYALLGANFLGGRYIVHKITDGQNVWEFPFWKYDLKTVHLIFDDKKYQILENTNAFPRAFLVENVVKEKDSQKILNKMFSKKFNLRNSAVVEEDLGLIYKLGTGSAKITKYSPNRIIIKTVSSKPSFLVLTDPFYPGWKATVDNRATPIYRTDFAFRGIVVPGGAHTVEFNYVPASFRYGIYVAIIGLIGIITIAILNARHRILNTKT